MRCPVCRAENVEATCRRCKGDISLLLTLEKARQHALTQSANAAATGDGPAALQRAKDAHHLRRAVDSWRSLALAHLLLRDYARALSCWRQMRDAGLADG
jgi:hypothetical protein